MQEQLNYIVQKLDKLDEKQDVMAETLYRNTITVEQHEQRSTQLETRLIPLERTQAILSIVVKLVVITASSLTAILGILVALKSLF